MQKRLHGLLILVFMLIAFGSQAQNLRFEPKPDNTYWLDASAVYSFPKIRQGAYYDEELAIRVPRDTVLSFPSGSQKASIIDLSVIEAFGTPKGLTMKYEVHNDITLEYFEVVLHLFGRVQQNVNAQLYLRFSYEALMGNRVFKRTRTVSNINLYSSNAFMNNDEFYSGKELFNLSATPNPMSDVSTISFNVIRNMNVTIEVHDVLGKKVFSRTMQALKGRNEAIFIRRNLPSGLYIYSIKSGNSTISKRLLIN